MGGDWDPTGPTDVEANEREVLRRVDAWRAGTKGATQNPVDAPELDEHGRPLDVLAYERQVLEWIQLVVEKDRVREREGRESVTLGGTWIMREVTLRRSYPETGVEIRSWDRVRNIETTSPYPIWDSDWVRNGRRYSPRRVASDILMWAGGG